MTGVGEQGKGMDREADDDLDNDKGEVQHDPDHKGPVHPFETDRVMVMPNLYGEYGLVSLFSSSRVEPLDHAR